MMNKGMIYFSSKEILVPIMAIDHSLQLFGDFLHSLTVPFHSAHIHIYWVETGCVDARLLLTM